MILNNFSIASTEIRLDLEDLKIKTYLLKWVEFNSPDGNKSKN